MINEASCHRTVSHIPWPFEGNSFLMTHHTLIYLVADVTSPDGGCDIGADCWVGLWFGLWFGERSHYLTLPAKWLNSR
ncbi:MAG: hypothetical protein F6K30_25710 [Cyanothece sp. SIO2G6]|nr:hypothetical protein [Cyanothece sp. SIO2G6]